MPFSSPPGPLLNWLNCLLHWPVIAPLLIGIHAAVVCLATSLLAPLAFAHGFLEACRQAAVALFGGETPTDGRAALAVVITGCDSGFGHTVAIELSSRGYTVFACCLQPPPDLQREATGRLTPIVMDVTRDDLVEDAEKAVRAWCEEKEGRRLLCVVNNAGIGTGGMCEWVSMADYERDCAVNYLGVVRVSKAFLPLLRRSAALARSGGHNPVATAAAAALLPSPPWAAPVAAPRLLIVSSMSGKMAMPLCSSYTASKHASAAFASALRMELTPWGVHVCTVLPTFHRTPLLGTALPSVRRSWDAAPPEVQAAYGEACVGSTLDVVARTFTDWSWDPARVVEALGRAATSCAKPPCEVVVGGDAILGLNVMRRFPAPVAEAICSAFMLWGLVIERGQ